MKLTAFRGSRLRGSNNCGTFYKGIKVTGSMDRAAGLTQKKQAAEEPGGLL